MLVFRGRWITVNLPVDPMLTQDHRMCLAAAAATAISRGVAHDKAVSLAEVEIYGEIFQNQPSFGKAVPTLQPSFGNNIAPQRTKKKSAV